MCVSASGPPPLILQVIPAFNAPGVEKKTGLSSSSAKPSSIPWRLGPIQA
jgi:hypothetical protein